MFARPSLWLAAVSTCSQRAEQLFGPVFVGRPEHVAGDQFHELFVVHPALFRRGALQNRDRDRPVVVVTRVNHGEIPEGFQIVDAGGGLRPRPRLLERRQQHRSENRDDRDHDQKFDQSEMPFHKKSPDYLDVSGS